MAENDLVHIGNFVEEWTAVLSDTDLDATDDAANAVSINISDDIAKELETVCGCVTSVPNIAHLNRLLVLLSACPIYVCKVSII